MDTTPELIPATDAEQPLGRWLIYATPTSREPHCVVAARTREKALKTARSQTLLTRKAVAYRETPGQLAHTAATLSRHACGFTTKTPQR